MCSPRKNTPGKALLLLLVFCSGGLRKETALAAKPRIAALWCCIAGCRGLLGVDCIGHPGVACWSAQGFFCCLAMQASLLALGLFDQLAQHLERSARYER